MIRPMAQMADDTVMCQNTEGGQQRRALDPMSNAKALQLIHTLHIQQQFPPPIVTVVSYVIP